MLLPDVNVLVYAFRADTPHHDASRAWLEGALAGPEPLAIADVVCSGFLRVVTHPRVFRTPAPLSAALPFISAIRSSDRALNVAPSTRHWEIFTGLCDARQATGNLVPDAWLAALAIEHGCALVTFDRDFAHFHGVRVHCVER